MPQFKKSLRKEVEEYREMEEHQSELKYRLDLARQGHQHYQIAYGDLSERCRQGPWFNVQVPAGNDFTLDTDRGEAEASSVLAVRYYPEKKEAWQRCFIDMGYRFDMISREDALHILEAAGWPSYEYEPPTARG